MSGPPSAMVMTMPQIQLFISSTVEAFLQEHKIIGDDELERSRELFSAFLGFAKSKTDWALQYDVAVGKGALACTPVGGPPQTFLVHRKN